MLECLQLEGNFMEALAFWRFGKGASLLLEVLHAGDGLTCAAWACMMRGKWPHMQSVSVGSGSLLVASYKFLSTPHCWSDLRKCVIWECRISAPIIAWIAQKWSHPLQTIDLTHCQIPGAAFQPFATADWRALKELHLRSASVDATAMSHLVRAKMSSLEILNLASNPGMNLAAFAELAQGDWPVMHSLILNGTRIDVHSTRELAKGRWRALQQLGLSACGIDVSCLRSLVSGQWPVLSDVDLSHNGLDSRSYKVLRGKSKQKLKLALNCFRPCCRFAAGHWPVLKYIDLTP